MQYRLLKSYNNTWSITYVTKNLEILVNNHPSLGVKFGHDLKSKAYIKNLAAKATRMLHMLYRILKGADTKTKKMAYCTLVRPILELEHSMGSLLVTKYENTC